MEKEVEGRRRVKEMEESSDLEYCKIQIPDLSEATLPAQATALALNLFLKDPLSFLPV